MSIYGDAGGDELSGGLAAPAGSGPKAANPLASVAAAAGPAISGIQAKAAADPQKAKMVCAGLCVLFVVLIGWGYYDSETSAMGRCDDACPDVMFSAGLINGLNGTAKDACGGQHVHDAAVPAHAISLHGDTRVSEIGAHFDGGGDYITVESFDYYSDGTFTIGFWYTKERCTGGIYEYLYSHNQYRNSMGDGSSNINIYLGCEEAGGGFTNLYNPSAPTGENRAGSTIRFSLTDTGGRGNAQNAVWDYPLHDARGSQDSILNVWMHVALAVDVPKQSMKTFIDGRPVMDDAYAYYCGSASRCEAVIGMRGNGGACVNDPPSPPAQPGCDTPPPSPPKTIVQGADRFSCRGSGVYWSSEQPEDWQTTLNGVPNANPWIPAGPPRSQPGTSFDAKCAYYNYHPVNGAQQVTNIACPNPSHLSGQFAGLLLLGDLHLGGRSDLNAYRHFTGRMAGVTIAGEAKTDVSCLFGCGHDALPGVETLQRDICTTIVTPLVKAPLTSPKCTGSDHVATGSCAQYGSRSDGQYAPAEFSATGARFDGEGDYIEIPSIDYGSDSTFTISFWFTKGQEGIAGGAPACTEHTYEYLYSHNQRSSGSITSYEDPISGAGSNVNIYMGCDQAVSGNTHTAGYASCNHDSAYHTPPGSVLRVNLMDSGTSARRAIPDDFCGVGGVNQEREVIARANWAMFDVSLHSAGSFDELTTKWVHFALTVTPNKVAVYMDGVEQHQFCFFDPQPSPPPPPDPNAGLYPPPPPPPPPAYCPAPPPAPNSQLAEQCAHFAECGQSYCPPPPPPPIGVYTPPPPPEPRYDVQDPRLNVAYPNPEDLHTSFSKFELAGPITIGGRSDHSRYRHFKGGMRSVSVYSSALTPSEINCIFTHDDALFSGALPAAGGAAVARPTAMGLMLVAVLFAWWQ